MSSLWDERIGPHVSRIVRLRDPDKVSFAVACIDRAVWRLWPTLNGVVPEPQLSVVEAAINHLWNMAAGARTPELSSMDHAGLVLSIYPDEGSPLALKPWGWQILIEILYHVLPFVAGEDVPYLSPNCGSFAAYQVTYQQRMYSIDPTAFEDGADPEAIEAYDRDLECRDPVLIADVQFHLDTLRRLERGMPALRSTEFTS